MASRGQTTSETAHAAAGQNVLLKIDAAKIAPSTAYQLQLVTASGSEVWKTQVASKDNLISVLVPRQLGKGKYWVRIYSGTDSETPVQEYGLAIE